MTIEAMKQALEALESGDGWRQSDAITALRTAIEQAEKQEPVAVVSGYYGGQCVVLPTNPSRLFNSGTALYTTPPAAQPAHVQEPVAWIITFEKQNGDRETCALMGRYKDVAASCDFGDPIPLYTTPPAQEFVCSTGLCHYKAQRQWVGLEPKDMTALVEQARQVPKEVPCPDYNERLLTLADAKLREKNTA